MSEERPDWREQIQLRASHRLMAAQSLETRRVISEVIRKSRAPFQYARRLTPREMDELENSLRELEAQLLARELEINRREAAVAELERDALETQALLKAKDSLVNARMLEVARQLEGTSGLPPTERRALDELEQRLAERERALVVARQEIKAREAFLEHAENTLFEKTMQQQEREAALEQQLAELEFKIATWQQLAGEGGAADSQDAAGREDGVAEVAVEAGSDRVSERETER